MYKSKKVICFLLSVSVIFAASTAFYISRSGDYDDNITYSYEQTFSVLSKNISNINDSLRKMQYSSSDKMLSSIASSVYRDCAFAKSSLNMLPLDDAHLDKINRYLSQAGEYLCSIVNASYSGTRDLESENKTISKLAAISSSLDQSMDELREKIINKEVLFGGMSRKDRSLSGDDMLLSSSLSDIETGVSDYGELSYDGPFSDSIYLKKPALLEGLSEISKEDAAKNAAWFLDTTAPKIAFISENDGVFKSYSFTDNEGSSICVSAAGGIVYSYLKDRAPGHSDIPINEAIEKAAAFLEEKGYKNMKCFRYAANGNMLDTEFVYVQNGIKVYPDSIKISVALDNGEITAFSAESYISNHASRSLPSPRISEDTARSKIKKGLSVNNVSLALIQSGGQNEIVCYELSCSDSSGTLIQIYINGDTGHEEKISILSEDEKSSLAI